MEVHTAEYNPLNASNYVPLPTQIAKKKAVLNIVNNDEKCFIWSILASLYPVSGNSHPYRVSNYIKYESELNCLNIEMPVSLLTCLILKNKTIYPLMYSVWRKTRSILFLLLNPNMNKTLTYY